MARVAASPVALRRLSTAAGLLCLQDVRHFTTPKAWATFIDMMFGTGFTSIIVSRITTSYGYWD